MPIYSVKGPDGRIYDVEGPAGASEADVVNFVRRQYLMSTPPAPEKKGSALGDVARSFGLGALGATGAVTSAAGADTAAARALDRASESLREGLSASRKAELQAQAERMKKAEASGSTLEEIKAGALNVLEAPLQSAAQAVGSFAPLVPTLFLAKPLAALGLGARSIMGIRGAIGAAQGAGAVKQSIYDTVLEAEKADGKTDEQAAAAASRAQAYISQNADQILAGAGLGAVAGTTGVERILPGGARGAASKAQEALAKRVGARAASGLTAAAAEAPLEGVQGGQERLAANLALQRTGRDVDAFTGVAGQAAQEALTGVLGAGPVGALFPDRRAEIAEKERQQKEQADAAAAAEAAKNTPDALRQLDTDYRAAEQRLAQLNAQVEAAKPAKGAPEEAKAVHEKLKAQRAEFVNGTYKPLKQEFNQRRGAITQMYEAQQAAAEVEAAPTQEAAKEAISDAAPQRDVQRLMDEQEQLRRQLTDLETQLTTAAPEQFDDLNAQRQNLQKRIDARATMIEEMGGSPLAQSEFEQATAAKMQAIDARLEKLNSTYATALENRDFDAAAKAKDDLLTVRQEREALTARTAQQMQALQEQQARAQQRGQTLDMFGEAPAAPTTAVDEQLRQQTLEEEKQRALYGPESKKASAEQAFGEAQVGPRGQLEPTTPMPETTAKTGIKPKQLELVEETAAGTQTAQTELADAVKTKDTGAIYAAMDKLNQAKSAEQRAQEEVGRTTFKPAVLDIFSPANIINTAIQSGNTKLINDLAKHTDRTALREALNERATEREKLINVLESRLDTKGMKRERADLFSKMYTAKQQAAFKNGTYPDAEMQKLYDQGGAAAVEYENILREIAPLMSKVTTKQGNAKQSLYEQLVDLAAQHEALTAQLESGVAAPTTREKAAALQAKLGKGEAPAERQMNEAERYQLQRKIDAIVKKYRLVEGKVKPIRDEINALYNSLYKTTELEKPSVAAAKKEKESRVYRTKPEQGAAAFLKAVEAASEPSTGEKGLREINKVELDLRPDEADENTVYFSLIRALKGAEKGAASKALKQITDLADRHGVTLVLQVEQVGKKGLTAEQLESWYARNGFKSGDRGMYRKPEAVTVAKPATSRTAATAARIAKGDVRKEAETSAQMRDLASKLGMQEPEYDTFGKGLMKRLKALEAKYGKNDPAVTAFRIQMADDLKAKAIELGKKTPEYKATLKEQIAYFQEVLPTAGKQEVPTKRTGPVTRKQSGAPKTLRVAGSAMTAKEVEAEVKAANEADGGIAYRLRESDAATTVDAAEAQKVIDGLKLPENVKFVYAPTAKQIPIKLLKQMANDGVDVADGMVQGAVFPDGTVLVVGDQHANVTDLEQTIAHELIGHYGVDTVIGLDRLNAYAKKTDVIKLAEQIGGKPLVSEVLNTVRANAALGKSEEIQKLQALREIIAHTEEARITESFREKAGRWLKELVGMVRAGLRDMGLKNVGELSTSDVFYMLKQSRKAFENKSIGVYRKADGETAFRLRKQASPYTTIGGEPGIVDKVVGNMLGLAGRVQFIDQYAALEAATKKGLSAGMISSLEATNANYLLRFGQQRSQFAGQFLTNGPVKAEIVKKDGGVETIYRSTKGTSMVDVANALNKAKIGNDTEQEHMFTLYLAGERANQVGWEKLNFADPAKAKAEYTDVLNRLRADKNAESAFKEAAKLYQEYNAGLLDFLVQTGALSAKKAAELKSISYVPFYRINQNGEVQLMIDKETPVRISNIKDQPQLKELVGGNTAILPVFTSAAQNTFMLTGMGLRNQAVKETSFMLQKLGIASAVREGKGPASDNVVRFFKNGEQYYALIDKEQFGIPAELIVRGMEGIKTTLPAIIKAMAIPANILRSFVVRNPAYAVRQIIRDPLNAWMTTGTDAVPVLSSMKELASMVAGRSDAERKLMETGAISSNVFSGDEQDMSKFLKDISAGKSGWDKAIAMLDTFALQGDAATRAVIYKDSLAKGMSEQEALLRTLESMNFSRRGVSPSMQALSVMIPFFNAQVQGLDVIYRAFKGDMPFSQQLEIRKKLTQRGLLLAGGTIAYAAMMEDDEAYKRAKPEERYSSWFVYIPGVAEPMRVPIPFEMGFLFKALPEAVWNVAMQDDKAEKAASGLSKLAMQTIPLSLPQAVKPLTEAVLGKSFYGGDIESAREKQELATDRYRENSTELAKTIGAITGKAGVSPITIDYLIRGYTGGLGIALVQLANPLLASDTKAAVAEPTTKTSKLPFIGGLFQPVEGRGTLDEAYDRMQEIQQTKGTYNKLLERGQRAEAMEFAQEYSSKLAAMSVSGAVQKRLGELAKIERRVRADPNMSTEEKDVQLKRLDAAKMALARQFLASTD